MADDDVLVRVPREIAGDVKRYVEGRSRARERERRGDSYFVRPATVYQVVRANVGGDVFVISEHQTAEFAEYERRRLAQLGGGRE